MGAEREHDEPQHAPLALLRRPAESERGVRPLPPERTTNEHECGKRAVLRRVWRGREKEEEDIHTSPLEEDARTLVSSTTLITSVFHRHDIASFPDLLRLDCGHHIRYSPTGPVLSLSAQHGYKDYLAHDQNSRTILAMRTLFAVVYTRLCCTLRHSWFALYDDGL